MPERELGARRKSAEESGAGASGRNAITDVVACLGVWLGERHFASYGERRIEDIRYGSRRGMSDAGPPFTRMQVSNYKNLCCTNPTEEGGQKMDGVGYPKERIWMASVLLR